MPSLFDTPFKPMTADDDGFAIDIAPLLVFEKGIRGIPERDIGFKVSSLRSRTLGIKQNIYARNLLRSGIRFSDISKIQRSQRLGNLPGLLKTE